MTDLERTLKNTLLTLEQELSATQKAHGTSLVNPLCHLPADCKQ
jgi:hypothetical protein